MGHPIRGDPLGVVVYVNQACEVNLFFILAPRVLV